MSDENEKTIMHRVAIALSNAHARVFRNQVGVCVNGKINRVRVRCSVELEPGDVYIKGARVTTAGLCKGSSDLIGWNSIEITKQMIGKRVAVFVACEVKSTDGALTPEQITFGANVGDQGGIWIVSDDAELAVKQLERWRPL